MKFQTLFLLFCSSQLTEAKKGISFVVIGDWANQFYLDRPKKVFDAINQMKRDATPGSAEDFDFFTTTGDNIYPHDEKLVTDSEMRETMNLFQDRSAISNLPIYPVRGNHDCYFDDQEYLLKLSRTWPQWQMENNYYLKEFDIGGGEKFSLVQVDSCLLLCQTIGRGPLPQKNMMMLMSLDAESREIYQSRCEGDQLYTIQGDDMMKWISKTFDNMKNDRSIAWKATSMHHPMFGIFYQDYHAIINDYLPRLQEQGFDAFFNGHEHLNAYASVFKNEKLQEIQYTDGVGCEENAEWFLSSGNSQSFSAKQGDKIHQFTLGYSGRHPYDLCVSNLRSSQGNFHWAQNKYQSFGLVTVTPEEFKVQYKGVDLNEVPQNGKIQIKDLYEVTLQRDKNYQTRVQKGDQLQSQKNYDVVAERVFKKFNETMHKQIQTITSDQNQLQKEMSSLKNDMSSINDFLKEQGTNPVVQTQTGVRFNPTIATKRSLGQCKQQSVNDLLTPMSNANDVSELY